MAAYNDDLALFVVGFLQLAAPCVNDNCFHWCVEGLMVCLAERGAMSGVEYLRRYIFRMDSRGLWDSTWRVCNALQLGLGPDTMGQAIESFWCALKEAMPHTKKQMMRSSLPVATKAVQNATSGAWCFTVLCLC